MPTLAVFTVKRFVFADGRYWTYGGFGCYIRAMLPHFEKIILCCHPRRAAEPPAGWYLLEDSRIEYYWLPDHDREDRALVQLPKMLLQCRDPARRADIINPRVPDFTGICGGFWGRWYKKPMFISHVADWHCRVRKPITRLRGLMRVGLQAYLAAYCWFEKRLCRRDALLFAQGNCARELYQDNPRVHLTVSSSHYDNDIVPFRQTCVCPDRCRLLAVGRHNRVKGFEDLIRAVRIAQDQDPHRVYELTIAGEGHITQTYRKLAAELGLTDQVKFPGQVGRTEIFELFDRSDMFILSSLSEGTPKVLLEAMARSVPVIATSVGGVPTVVMDEKTGVLVPPKQPTALAGAILRMARDEHLRKTCAEGGLEMARSHSVEVEWGNMMDIVRSEYAYLWDDGDR